MRGSVRKHFGSWQARYAVVDAVTGTRRLRCRSFATRDEGERWLAREIGGYVGEVTDAVDLTVAGLLDEWLEASRHDLSPTTLRTYRRMIPIISAAIGHHRVTKLTPRIMERWIADLRDQGLAPSSIRRYYSIVHAAVTRAVSWRYLPVDPIRGTRLPSDDRDEVRVPTDEEVRTLLAESFTLSLEFGVLTTLAVTTGARRGELLALRWSDVDLDRAEARIERSIAFADDADGETTVVVKATKTGRRGARTIGLTATAVEALRRLRARAAEVALRTGVPIGDPFIFTDEDGGPWRPDRVTRAWSRVRERVGLTHVRWHDLRHSHASTLIAAGVPITTVSGRLGHSSPRTTLNVYGHSIPGADRQAADMIDRLYGLG